MERDVVIVGGGMAGLTAAAYLGRAGVRTLLLEKQAKTGGLVNSFERGGCLFDGGIRAIENSGILLPMLRQLGIELELLENPVSIGFGRDVITLSSGDSLRDYRELLLRQFPSRPDDIARIVDELKKVMGYMDVLYGIDNPLFMDLGDLRYVSGTVLPWLIKYLATLPKLVKLKGPVEERLAKLTGDRALIDMIAQHFFRKTPAFFALSYFSLYLDYRYPKGGTGALAGKLEEYARGRGTDIRRGVEVARLVPGEGKVVDSRGSEYAYDRLVWAADAKTLYRIVDTTSMSDRRAAGRIAARARELADKRGGDSVFTLYLALDMDSGFFAGIASGHLFYTPVTRGLSEISLADIEDEAAGDGADRPRFTADKAALFAWIGRYLELTTYEISCPALRDPALAPRGKTGLIVSTLVDYSLIKHFRERGWHEELKEFGARKIVDVLDSSVYPGLKSAIIESFVSTPLTIEELTGNFEGAITGWAFTNDPLPAVHEMLKVARSVLTPIPGLYQAGQWSFSPSGLPISILTGKLAADRIVGDFRRG